MTPKKHFSCWNSIVFLLLSMTVFSSLSFSADGSTANNTREKHPPFRLSFSANMFHDVNETDIMAALKVWILTVAKDLEIDVDPNPNIQPSITSMIKFAEKNHVSGFAALSTEILELSKHFTFDQIAVGENRGVFGDRYIVLVRADSGINSLEDLKGAAMIEYNSPHMSLGEIWLETELIENGLGKIETFFASSTQTTKPAQVVLPVFFGKKTACLITRDTFEIMGELNPQLGQQLRILEQSPMLITAGFVFIEQPENKGYRDEIIDAMGKLDQNTAGEQLLAMTQSSVIKALPISNMQKSFALIRKHRQLVASIAD